MAKPKEELPVPVVSGPPPSLRDRIRADAGKGTSQAAEDNIVPLVYVLQALSPQVDRRRPEHIDGAEPGAILLRNGPVLDGEGGVLFQPCSFSKDFVEWVPRDKGGGLVARHARVPDVAKKPEGSHKWIMPSGNEVVETRYHVGHVILPGKAYLPYVIPMTGSNHTTSKTWMGLLNAAKDEGVLAPSYAKLYRLTTRQRTNNQGTWFMWAVSDAGWVEDVVLYELGAALHEAFASGAKQVAEEEREHEGGASEDAPM